MSTIQVGDVTITPVQEWRDHLDADRPLATASRRRILGWAADHQAAFLAAHFPIERAARIARRGDSFAIDGWTALV